jgi:hypothetical protein
LTKRIRLKYIPPVERKFFIFDCEAIEFAKARQAEGMKVKVENDYNGTKITVYEKFDEDVRLAA